jgi:putative MATE family efflux protein
MGTAPINKLLLSMSIPMMISMMVQALYNVVDSIFVARFSENALTAVSLAFPIQMLIIAVSNGLGVGINALLSRSLGEKKYGDVNNIAQNGIFLAWSCYIIFMIIGFLFSKSFFRTQTDIVELVEYGHDYLFIICVFSFGAFNQMTFERLLISTGKTFYTMISQSIGAITNIILDPIMIFGLLGCPKMGVAGAAYATVIGQILSAAAALYFNIRKNKEIKLSIKGFRPNGAIIKEIGSVGIPATLMHAMSSVMTYGLNLILVPFTATAAAVFGIYFKLQSFVFMLVIGLNNAMVPIVAYNFGAKNTKRIVKVIKLSIFYSVGITLIFFVLFQLFPSKLLMLFNASPSMLAIGYPALRIISMNFLIAGACIVLSSVFQALGNGMESLIISIARQVVVLLPVAWFLSLSGIIQSIWWAFPISEFVSLLLSVVLFKRLYARKLKHL